MTCAACSTTATTGMWIGTYGGGLDRLQRGRPEFVHQHHNPDQPDSLSSNLVTSATIDHTGALWVGTDGGGVNLYDAAAVGGFRSFRHDPNEPTSLSTDRVYSRLRRQVTRALGRHLRRRAQPIRPRSQALSPLLQRPEQSQLAQPQHRLVVRRRLSRVGVGRDRQRRPQPIRSLKTRRWRHYLHDPEDTTSLSHNTVRFVLIDSHGDLWAATNGGGLNRYDPEKRRVHPIPPRPERPPLPQPRRAAFDLGGHVGNTVDCNLRRRARPVRPKLRALQPLSTRSRGRRVHQPRFSAHGVPGSERLSVDRHPRRRARAASTRRTAVSPTTPTTRAIVRVFPTTWSSPSARAVTAPCGSEPSAAA